MNNLRGEMRLSKRMAELGLCSRREADEYISRGLVSVNGVPAVLGQKVTERDRIEMNRVAERDQSRRVTILLHKPLGYVSGQAEDGYRPARVLIRPENCWSGDKSPLRFDLRQLQNLVPAGRLDVNSTGLLVLTQDGRVARRLVGEDSAVEKEYLVRVAGSLSERGLALLNHGLSLDGEELLPARVRWQNDDQLRFVLQQGKKTSDPPHVRSRRARSAGPQTRARRFSAPGGAAAGTVALSASRRDLLGKKTSC